MSDSTSRMAADLCNALGLKRCVSFKIEVDTETMMPMVTSVQYLGHDQFHALDKVLRQYRLEPISETPLPTPDVEAFLDGRVHTFRLPEHSPASDPT